MHETNKQNTKYTPIIGLEIHVELNTKSKMFCQCPADYFGAEPNTHTCPVCLGMPGALPVPNKEAIRRTILLGMALGCEINQNFKFDRKHYFYPDLSKSYQISQYDEPIAEHGYVQFYTAEPTDTSTKTSQLRQTGIRIKRVHLEEDTGKLTHTGQDSLIDFNRGGVPLVEIVTEPDFHNADDVKQFLHELQVIVRYLGIANADMEKGDMRLEPNISVQVTEKVFDASGKQLSDDKYELPKYKAEVKNINSFNFVKKAIEFEVERHIEILERGELPPQETRGYDSATGTTVSQRTKEDAHDYRYFPDPDIPPFSYTKEQYDEIRKELPELSQVRLARYMDSWGVKYSDAYQLTRDLEQAKYFETVVSTSEALSKERGAKLEGIPQLVANAIINKKVSTDLSPKEFAKKLVESSAPKATDMGALDEAVKKVLSANPKAVEDFKSGKNPNAVMSLIGGVMKELGGKADAGLVRERLVEGMK